MGSPEYQLRAEAAGNRESGAIGAMEAELGRGDAESVERAAAIAETLNPAEVSAHGVAVWYRLADAAERLGQDAAAVTQYRRILQCPAAAPTAAAAHFRLGVCCGRMGDSAAAIEHYLHAIDRSLAAPEPGRLARWELSGELLLQKDFAGAEAQCRKLCEDAECAPLYGPVVELRQTRCLVALDRPEWREAARALASRAAGFDCAAHPATVTGLFETAIAIEIAGDYELAARLYSTLLENPSLPRYGRAAASYRLALCLEQLSRWYECIPLYRTAIALGEGSSEAMLARGQLGVLLMANEEYAEAAEIYAALCAAPGPLHIPLAEAQYRRAFCLTRTGRIPEAEAVLAAIARDSAPQEVVAKIDYLSAEIFEMHKEYRSAATCYERIVANAAAEIPLKASALQKASLLAAMRP
jgi:tetratricopeptide (TPR) repeat protein